MNDRNHIIYSNESLTDSYYDFQSNIFTEQNVTQIMQFHTVNHISYSDLNKIVKSLWSLYNATVPDC